MEIRQRQPVLYNAEQALDILLQSDDEDIGKVQVRKAILMIMFK